MSLRQFEYALAVAEEGSVTAAAERPHVAQPSMSQQIRNLERELGVTLFARTPTGLVPTVLGRAFLRDAEVAVSAARRARATARAGVDELVGELMVAAQSIPPARGHGVRGTEPGRARAAGPPGSARCQQGVEPHRGEQIQIQRVAPRVVGDVRAAGERLCPARVVDQDVHSAEPLVRGFGHCLRSGPGPHVGRDEYGAIGRRAGRRAGCGEHVRARREEPAHDTRADSAGTAGHEGSLSREFFRAGSVVDSGHPAGPLDCVFVTRKSNSVRRKNSRSSCGMRRVE